ncbi:MerR family transcriptional regulator [Modestobacter excelsi]|uniref:MerR family transcriptional regulator n=1 Tax=Modestobacter excelsi TaxID=2213161 RepID=UPI001FE24786|nr:MerR family transcriptional regulator [Modestobacter excelsi]
MLTIGEFAQLTHLSVRTLRRHHDARLLEPARVAAASGYRYYSAEQIPAAQVIHRLRGLDVPLPDVQRILQTPDPAREPSSSSTICSGSRTSWSAPVRR